ncbi:MAG: hypothetical protein ACLFTE_05025 [Salinivenus sp.]
MSEIPAARFLSFCIRHTQLVGRWEWRQSTTYGPGEPETVTPTTTGRTETLVFSSPDTVQVYQNDTLGTAPQEDVLARTQWGVRADTFVTSTAARDGPEKIYVRVD